jgi:hypothetical protein
MAPARRDVETAAMRFQRTHRATEAATRRAKLEDTAHGWLPCRGITMSRFTALTATAVTAALFAGFHPPLHAQPDPSLADVPLPRLQSMVLSCDLQSTANLEQTHTTAFCAFAADELRRRAFDGDHERLLAWWRDERTRLKDGAKPAPQTRAGGGEPPAAMPVAAPAATPPFSHATPEQLKSAYLQCERLALATPLDFGTAAQCSMVYEALKQRVFGGDFERLLAWWRQESKSTEDSALATP